MTGIKVKLDLRRHLDGTTITALMPNVNPFSDYDNDNDCASVVRCS
jgi:hypothetical protein